MKYEHTEEKNIKRHPDTGFYYFKRGKVEVSLKTKDFKEAKLRAQLEIAIIEAAGTVAFKFTVNDLFQSYYHERSKADLSEGTLKELDYLFQSHLLPFFGTKKLYKITPVLWSKYVQHKKHLDLSNHRKVFQGFLKWCRRRGYIKALPDVSEITKPERRKRRIVRDAELKALFTHAKGSLRLFLALALYNGLRRKEIMTLRWSNIDLNERFLVVQKEFNKLGRGRSLPFNSTICALLSLRYEETKSPWVFPHALDPRKHADLGGLKTAWQTCLRRAQLEGITWHDFRATHEKFAHKSKEHTDTQREKFADSSSDVQKRIYVSMDHDDLLGLESVVQVPGLESVILDSGRTRGEI